MSETRISASEFKARCSRIIDAVARGRGPVIITKRGRPVARVVAVDRAERKSLFGFAKGNIHVHGDIVAPVDEDWEAET